MLRSIHHLEQTPVKKTALKKVKFASLGGSVALAFMITMPFATDPNASYQSAANAAPLEHKEQVPGTVKSVPIERREPVPSAAKTAPDEHKDLKVSQKIKDHAGHILYASNSPDFSSCVNDALRAGTNLAGAEINQAEIGGLRIENGNLAGAHFKNCELSALTILNTNLSGASFDGCKLTHMRFKNDSLNSVRFSNCKLNSAFFHDSKLKGAKFQDCEIGTVARRGRLSGIEFKTSDLDDIQLLGGVWSNCKLFSNLHNAKLSTTLSDSTIACTKLSDANFGGSKLVSCKIIAPDAKSVKFGSMKNTTIEPRLPGE